MPSLSRFKSLAFSSLFLCLSISLSHTHFLFNSSLLHCGVRTGGQAVAGLMINDVYTWQKAPLFICIAASQISSVTWMKNIHSYQFCSIIEWSHFPSVVFYLLSLTPSLSLFSSSLFSSAIWPSYHRLSNFHTAS